VFSVSSPMPVLTSQGLVALFIAVVVVGLLRPFLSSSTLNNLCGPPSESWVKGGAILSLLASSYPILSCDQETLDNCSIPMDGSFIGTLLRRLAALSRSTACLGYTTFVNLTSVALVDGL
jgi:hypothetical protein